MRRRIDISVIVPFILLAIILAFFVIKTDGLMINPRNLRAIFDQSMLTIIVALGTIFVVSTGGADLSVGTTIGITTVFGAYMVGVTGTEWVVFPLAILLALAQGLINGLLVTKLRVPSFMVTLAMLIGMRGVVNFAQSKQTGLYFAGAVIDRLRGFDIKIPVLVILVLLTYYLLHHTKFGEYCRAIGENESVAISVGVPVAKVKTITFVLSSLMAAIAGFFLMARVGGTNTTMGVGVEIEVLMAIFIGSVLVTGGYSAKIPKLIIGAFTLTVIKNGMFMIRMTSIRDTQLTQGLLLLLILFITMQVSNRELSLSFLRRKVKSLAQQETEQQSQQE